MTLIRLKASSLSSGLFPCFVFAILTTGCSHFRQSGTPDSEKKAETLVKTPEQVRIETLENQIGQLQSKLDKVEADLQSSTQKQRQALGNGTKMGNGIVESTELVQSSVALSDPEKGFVQDSAVLSLRQSKVLYDSEKFPEAILGFSTFVEKNVNHPLASQAQYYLADSYFRQNDFPIAEKEFKRLVRNYPQSPLLSRARERLRACAEKTTSSPAPVTAPPALKKDSPTSAPAPAPENVGSAQSSALRRDDLPLTPPSGAEVHKGNSARSMSDLDLAPIEESPSGNIE